MRKRAKSQVYRVQRMPFGLWQFSVFASLTHPDAIYCTVGDSEKTLEYFYQAGFKPGAVARRLNERYATGFLERKEAHEEADDKVKP